MSATTAADLALRMRAIRLVTCDVDGVLTDGRIYVDDHGHDQGVFGAGRPGPQDAAACRIARRLDHRQQGARRHAPRPPARRPHVIQGAEDKITPWDRLREELRLPAAACAHIGDDLPDVPLFNRCGLAVAVPHAPDAVRARAHYVTRCDGGVAPCAKCAN